ncbi:MAG: acyl carrier protein [Nocardioidaceae bacterium]|nr:acyl carrier protein [Nocardioidaceae bacterium]
MSESRPQVEDAIRGFLERSNKSAEIADATSLYGDGLGLDSLEVAELSVLLEDTFGKDPFSAGLEVGTVGQILDFYSPTA